MPRRRTPEEEEHRELFFEMMDDYFENKKSDKESWFSKLLGFLSPTAWKPGDPDRRKPASKKSPFPF